jgi:hypothetical protein
MRTPALTTCRDLALIALSPIGGLVLIEELRAYKPPHALPPLYPPSPLDLPPRRTEWRGLRVPDPKFSWLYELTGYTDDPRRIRPAGSSEREASDQTLTVDGAGIFALMPDNTIIRSDDPTYPPPAGTYVRYCRVAP